MEENATGQSAIDVRIESDLVISETEPRHLLSRDGLPQRFFLFLEKVPLGCPACVLGGWEYMRVPNFEVFLTEDTYVRVSNRLALFLIRRWEFRQFH